MVKIKSHTKIEHFAHKDVGKGCEQDAEASSVMAAVKFVTYSKHIQHETIQARMSLTGCYVHDLSKQLNSLEITEKQQGKSES
ncbi:MAG: hypothetical protein GY777_04110 [Candidatus Brocadiaceae bacterium]|nr:hypothetical protein [Candidatus Brocadiaceae bacterium]